MVLDYSKLEFLEVLPSWHHLTWHLGIKKFHLVLEFLGLEYCASLVPESVKLEYQSVCEAPIFGVQRKTIQIDTQVHKTRVLC